MRVKKEVPQAVLVLPEVFAAPGTWVVVRAPATVEAVASGEAAPMRGDDGGTRVTTIVVARRGSSSPPLWA
jgi:hypothetical protein